MPSYEIVQAKLDAVQAEMKRIGMWQSKSPTPDQMQFTRAFGGDKLAFDQWLQFVFVPRVQSIIDHKARFPPGSQVAGQAYREWKMWGDLPNSDTLIQLLRDFDALFH